MIVEAIQHFLTPALREVKALGYVREAIAIDARYARCRDAWAGHLEKCKKHILAATDSLPPNSTVMIIGSGALHDVPLREIEEQGRSLTLVDIVHLPRIRKLCKNNIQLIEQDVTGWVRPLFHKRQAKEIRNNLPKTDLVISLNILSQLPLNLIKYAERHNIPLPDNFARTIMAEHLDMINSLAPQSLIISDLDRSYKNEDELLEKESALPELELPCPHDIWDWDIVPKGELDRRISLIHHVACWLK